MTLDLLCTTLLFIIKHTVFHKKHLFNQCCRFAIRSHQFLAVSMLHLQWGRTVREWNHQFEIISLHVSTSFESASFDVCISGKVHASFILLWFQWTNLYRIYTDWFHVIRPGEGTVLSPEQRCPQALLSPGILTSIKSKDRGNWLLDKGI